MVLYFGLMASCLLPVLAADGDVYVTGGSLDDVRGTVYIDAASDSSIVQQSDQQIEVLGWLIASVSLGTGSICGAIIGRGIMSGV